MKKTTSYNTCKDGDCPQGIEAVRRIRLTSTEKRAIFLNLTIQIDSMETFLTKVEKEIQTV